MTDQKGRLVLQTQTHLQGLRAELERRIDSSCRPKISEYNRQIKAKVIGSDVIFPEWASRPENMVLLDQQGVKGAFDLFEGTIWQLVALFSERLQTVHDQPRTAAYAGTDTEGNRVIVLGYAVR